MSEEKVSVFDLIYQTDYRYRVKDLGPYLYEESFVKYKSKIEAALAKVLARRGIISRASAEEISNYERFTNSSINFL